VKYPAHIHPGETRIRIHKEGRCGWVRPEMSEDQATWFEDFDSTEAAEEFVKRKGYRVDFCVKRFGAE
jgi:hypothetical protein